VRNWSAVLGACIAAAADENRPMPTTFIWVFGESPSGADRRVSVRRRGGPGRQGFVKV